MPSKLELKFEFSNDGTLTIETPGEIHRLNSRDVQQLFDFFDFHKANPVDRWPSIRYYLGTGEPKNPRPLFLVGGDKE